MPAQQLHTVHVESAQQMHTEHEVPAQQYCLWYIGSRMRFVAAQQW